MTRVIRQVEDLIRPHLNHKQKFVSCDFQNLLPFGENYGSVMLKMEIKLSDENGKEDILYCVGKTVPPSEMLWNLFNTKVTFKKEIAVYNVVVPELNKFGKKFSIDCLIDFTAKCLGARISLNPESKNVDHDAALLLENLKLQGYEVCDRFSGFDELTSKLLLKDLAVLHAAAIAYRKENPIEFKDKIRPYLNKDYAFHLTESQADKFAEAIQENIAKNKNCVPYLSTIKKALREMSYFNANPPQGKEIFNTFTHNDFWINNTMVKFEDGKPIANKMVDFQVIEYGSLAHDVIFFLYSSVNMDTLETKMDELIEYYHEKFIETLVRLQYDTSEYTFEAMMEEFRVIATDGEFAHLVYMFVPILTLKTEGKELAELDFEDFIFKEESVHKIYERRMQFTLLDFVRRGWL